MLFVGRTLLSGLSSKGVFRNPGGDALSRSGLAGENSCLRCTGRLVPAAAFGEPECGVAPLPGRDSTATLKRELSEFFEAGSLFTLECRVA